jgi:nitroreductase
MTTATDTQLARTLRRAAIRATRAPSVHNTQPWRFVVRDGGLDIVADWTRRLNVLDPRGRQLLMSVGCAVLNARVALAADGQGVTVERFADASRPDLVARIVPSTSWTPDPALARLEPSIDTRQTNRRRFLDEQVPDDVLDVLAKAAHAEGSELFPVTREDHRATLAALSQLADKIENSDPGYRAELRRWTSDDPRRLDGVPSYAVPHVTGAARDEIPIRDFDTRGMGWLPETTESSSRQCLVLLGTNSDSPAAWEQCGEALERMLLEVSRLGYTSSPLTQVIEVPRTHGVLRESLGLQMHPHILIRIGKAPLTTPTRRRRLVEVMAAEE